MPLRILTWLISLGIHAGFALAMLLPAGGAALQTGAGEDTMVVEQGIAIEGFAKMGEDQVSLEEVEATPVMAAVSQPLPEEVEPSRSKKSSTSKEGPQQEDLKEPEEEVVEQPLPPQIAAVQQESVVAMRESSARSRRAATPRPIHNMSARFAPILSGTRSIPARISSAPRSCASR